MHASKAPRPNPRGNGDQPSSGALRDARGLRNELLRSLDDRFGRKRPGSHAFRRQWQMREALDIKAMHKAELRNC